MRKLMRQTLISALMLAVVGLSFASKGGGGDKKTNKNTSVLKTEFTPIRTTSSFTLKAGPSYGGSIMLNQERTRTTISFNTLITYQKGNSLFILPYKYTVNIPNLADDNKSSLQLLDLRIRMHK